MNRQQYLAWCMRARAWMFGASLCQITTMPAMGWYLATGQVGKFFIVIAVKTVLAIHYSLVEEAIGPQL